MHEPHSRWAYSQLRSRCCRDGCRALDKILHCADLSVPTEQRAEIEYSPCTIQALMRGLSRDLNTNTCASSPHFQTLDEWDSTIFLMDLSFTPNPDSAPLGPVRVWPIVIQIRQSYNISEVYRDLCPGTNDHLSVCCHVRYTSNTGSNRTFRL